MEPHRTESCQHSQPQLPEAAPALSHDPTLGVESRPNTLLSSASPSRAKFSFLASRPINLSTPVFQQQMGCSRVKATFVIIPATCSRTGFTAIDAIPHKENNKLYF